MHQRSSSSCPYNRGNSYRCRRWCASIPLRLRVMGCRAATSRAAEDLLQRGSRGNPRSAVGAVAWVFRYSNEVGGLRCD